MTRVFVKTTSVIAGSTKINYKCLCEEFQNKLLASLRNKLKASFKKKQVSLRMLTINVSIGLLAKYVSMKQPKLRKQ